MVLPRICVYCYYRNAAKPANEHQSINKTLCLKKRHRTRNIMRQKSFVHELGVRVCFVSKPTSMVPRARILRKRVMRISYLLFYLLFTGISKGDKRRASNTRSNICVGAKKSSFFHRSRRFESDWNRTLSDAITVRASEIIGDCLAAKYLRGYGNNYWQRRVSQN